MHAENSVIKKIDSFRVLIQTLFDINKTIYKLHTGVNLITSPGFVFRSSI